MGVSHGQFKLRFGEDKIEILPVVLGAFFSFVGGGGGKREREREGGGGGGGGGAQNYA